MLTAHCSGAQTETIGEKTDVENHKTVNIISILYHFCLLMKRGEMLTSANNSVRLIFVLIFTLYLRILHPFSKPKRSHSDVQKKFRIEKTVF